MLRDILVSIVQALLRTLLGGFVGWLVAQGALTHGQASMLIGVIAGVVVNVAWEYGAKLVRRWHLETALALDPKLGLERLTEISRATPLADKLKEAVTGASRSNP